MHVDSMLLMLVGEVRVFEFIPEKKTATKIADRYKHKLELCKGKANEGTHNKRQSVKQTNKQINK